MKIAVVGAGNMGGAVARSLVKAGVVPAADVTVSDLSDAVLQRFSEQGYPVTHNNAQAVQGADVVFLVVKPWLVEQLVGELKGALDYASQVFVCIAAGITPEQLTAWLGTDAAGVAPQSFLVIPNTAIDVLKSMTFITPVHASQASIDLVKGLFDAVGSSEMGFSPAEAVPVVCQTVVGALGLMMQEGADPEAEIVKVCTPGGLTLKGLKEMEEAGFTSAIIRGLKASVK